MTYYLFYCKYNTGLRYTLDKFSNIASKRLKLILVSPFQRQNFIFIIGPDNNNIVPRCKYLERGVIDSFVRYHNEISTAKQTSKSSSNAKKDKALFFGKHPDQFQFNQLMWRDY